MEFKMWKIIVNYLKTVKYNEINLKIHYFPIKYPDKTSN